MRFLPRTLLFELGRSTATWSYIEQHLMIHASAMFSQDTDGWPKEYLRMEFRRLREKWWKEIAARYPATEVNRIFQPLNMRLAEASTTRGYMMHGKWNVDRPGVYVLEWWEQKDALRSYRMAVTLAQMRAFNAGLETLFADIVSATEEHGPED